MHILNFTDSQPLSASEASGLTAISPSRRHQVPRNWPSPILRFMDSPNRARPVHTPPSATNHPLPLPRRGHGPAAA